MTYKPTFRVCRVCDWPSCLSPEQAKQLSEECEYSLRGDVHPNPDLTDYRKIHGCVEPPKGGDDVGDF